MKACFKLAALPAFLTVWWASQGLSGIDWRVAWPWCVGLVAGTWVSFWGIMYALFPTLKFNSKARMIARMNDDLTESDPR